MQGHPVCSEEGGEVRIIDYIKGRTLSDETEEFPGSHETYSRKLLPSLLEMLLPCLNALHALHGLGEGHGDVRTDHLMLDKETGKLRWIDFDCDFICREAPFAVDLLGIGNIRSELVGKRKRTIYLATSTVLHSRFPFRMVVRQERGTHCNLIPMAKCPQLPEDVQRIPALTDQNFTPPLFWPSR